MSSNPSRGPQQDASGRARIPGPPRIDVPTAGGGRVVTTPGREQDQSIRERKQLLFDDEELPVRGDGQPAEVIYARPFRDYLRNTPAAALSNVTKGMLYAAGAVVLLMLLAALLKRG